MIPSVVMLGHQDHGKSTFLGKLLAETGSIPADRIKTVQEIDDEAHRKFEWAHLLDAFKEEREQEMTYGSAAAYVTGKSRQYLFFDVPGHKELVHHMLGSASRAHAAVLIVSAKENEGVDVMSVKHLLLARLLGVKTVIVAVNKMDTHKYDENIFERIKAQIEEEVKKAGFDSKETLYVPISAFDGENIAKNNGKASWYKGPAVFEAIEGVDFEALERGNDLPYRRVIQDEYKEGGQTVLIGNVKSGSLTLGTRTVLLPSHVSITEDKFMDSNGNSIKIIETGFNVGTSTSVPIDASVVGNIQVEENRQPEFTSTFPAKLFVFGHFDPKDLYVVECGKMRANGKPFEAIASHEIVPLTITLDAPILIDTEPTFLHQFVIKQKGEIVGVGIVE